MADSLLNHSWPSFSRRWMKRWSFKRGSECKPVGRDFPGGRTPPTSGCSTPEGLSPSLIAEDEVFFGTMAEEREDASPSPDQDRCPGTVHSSTEDLISIDSALQGSEYFKDLGLAGPMEASSAWRTQSSSGEMLATVPCPEMAHHYLDEECACSCSSGGRGGFAGAEPEQPSEAVESFPGLVRSMSTSRRYSWESPMSPTDAQRRFSLDASELGSDTEKGVEKEKSPPDLSPPLPRVTWSNSEGANVEPEPLRVELDFRPEAGDGDLGGGGKRLRSKSVPSPCDSFHPSRISRSLEVSLPIPVVIMPPALEMTEKHHIAPELIVQQVLKELTQCHRAQVGPCVPEGSSETQQNLTWFEFLSHSNEESGKSEKTERGTKVKRRLSNLRNRVTGSWQKDKGKNKEAVEAKEEAHARHGHELVPGVFSNSTCCSVCGKVLPSRSGLQCSNCAVNVHKHCKSLLPECSSSSARTKQRDSLLLRPPGSPLSSLRSFGPAASLKEQPHSALLGPDGGTPGLPRGLGMTIAQRGSPPSQLSAADASAGAVGKLGPTGAEMDEGDGVFKAKPATEDVVSLTSATTSESVFVEDTQYASLQNELETDAREFAAQSWSLAVEPSYVKQQPKEVIKRQDVIYELMRTEMHHVRTLKIMLKVYSRAMREELQLGNAVTRRLFPCVDELLELHGAFLSQLKERRKEALEEGSERNYVIHRIGDLLVQQFSGETGERLKEKYGVFCSRHSEAVGYYKELLQQSKKFQSLIKKLSQASIVRRLNVQECTLLVTQRIMKYPVLVERVIQNTEAGIKEYADLTQALALIKEAITAVDAQVNETEKGQRLREIASKMELKSSGKFKNGLVFRKEDILQRRFVLDAVLSWKAASGRLKDVLAVLLTDVLLLLQEKDQKYTFASMDSKPPVISLQKLIVREVANEERAMFLISASMKGPEMYEIYTNSKEERNFWMAQIRRAVESCPDEDGGILPDAEEERRRAEARVVKLKEFQDRLSLKDDEILERLSEKQQIYLEMAEMNGFEDTVPGSRGRLFYRAESPESLQGEAILKRAVTEVEGLQNLLFVQLGGNVNSRPEDASGPSLLRRAETFGGYDSAVAGPPKTGSFKKKVCGGEPWPRDHRGLPADSEATFLEPPPARDDGPPPPRSGDPPRLEQPSSLQPLLGTESELLQRIQALSQLLLGLQAVMAQQDSCLELQRSTLADREKQFRLQSTRGSLLLEQERQRNFEKQREELAGVQKLQGQLKSAQQRWEREQGRQRGELAAAEEAALRLQQRLAQQREELERQRQAYQRDLERLREAQRAVEKERERLEQLRRIKKQQQPPPAGPAPPFSPPEGGQAHSLSHSASFNGEGPEAGTGATTTPTPPKSSGRASVSGVGYLERAELARRDSGALEGGRPLLALKGEVPLHLLSATNQLQKPAAVQQQIPTKLAAFTKGGKEKGGKGGRAPSHRADSTASLDMRHLLPTRPAGKEEPFPRSRLSASPVLPHSQIAAFPPEPPAAAESSHAEAPPASANLFKPNSVHALSPALDDGSNEDVIFF